jgi:hypothetical protein
MQTFTLITGNVSNYQRLVNATLTMKPTEELTAIEIIRRMNSRWGMETREAGYHLKGMPHMESIKNEKRKGNGKWKRI